MAKWKWTEKLFGRDEDIDGVDDEYTEDEYVSASPAEAAPQTPRQTGAISSSASAALEMKIMKPEKYEDVKSIADHLLAKRTVVLNLEGTNRDTVKRILDFLAGTTYAIEGQIKRAANSTYVITPKNVDVSADLAQEPEAHKELF